MAVPIHPPEPPKPTAPKGERIFIKWFRRLFIWRRRKNKK